MLDMQDIQVPIYDICPIIDNIVLPWLWFEGSNGRVKLCSDPHFPDLNKCVPEKECPATATDMEMPGGLPEDASGIK